MKKNSLASLHSLRLKKEGKEKKNDGGRSLFAAPGLRGRAPSPSAAASVP